MGGFKEGALKGLLTGHPVINTRVILEDGAAHEVDSSEHAFQQAGTGAFETAFTDAGPAVLQTLNQREGAIQTTTASGMDSSTVEAVVPLRKMFGYSSELRSVTQGQGEFSMEFERYEEMPAQAAEQLSQEYRQRLREDRAS